MVEGVVSFASEFSKNQDLELVSKTGRTKVRLLERSTGSLSYLQGCQIRAEGFCEAGLSVNQQTNFSILVPNDKFLTIKTIPSENWRKYPMVPIDLLSSEDFNAMTQTLIHVNGTVCSNLSQSFIIRDKTAEVQVITKQPRPNLGKKIEILGELLPGETNMTLMCLFYKESDPEHDNSPSPLTPLMQAADIKKLTRTEAQQAYPVKIRGIITAAIETGFSIQDATWSTYLNCDRSMTGDFPRVGDYCEIEGNTTMIFAPSVTAKRVTRLEKGILPIPIQPRWDELINGSLDTQYIQLEGYVLAVNTNTLYLLTRDGKLKLRLPDIQDKALTGLTGALISVRGVNSPERDTSQRTIVGQLRLFNAAINVKEPPPAPPV